MVKKISGNRTKSTSGINSSGSVDKTSGASSIGKVSKTSATTSTNKVEKTGQKITSKNKAQILSLLKEEAEKMFDSIPGSEKTRKTVEDAVRMVIDSSQIEDDE